VSSRLTTAEAYTTSDELLDVALDFGQGTLSRAGFELYQNYPNPFVEATLIGFHLPEAGEATLRIQDVMGRTLRIIRGEFAQGYNELRLQRQDLPASGMLTYTLESGDHVASKKMILFSK